MYIVRIFGIYVATLKIGQNGFYATGRTFAQAIENVINRTDVKKHVIPGFKYSVETIQVA